MGVTGDSACHLPLKTESEDRTFCMLRPSIVDVCVLISFVLFLKKKMITANELRQQIHDLQRIRGMEPRHDSRLTEQFVNGVCDPVYQTVHDVVDELVMVDRIHRTTLYPDVIEEVLRDLALCVRKKTNLSWTQTWDVVKFYGPTLLKLHMIRRSWHITRLELPLEPAAGC